MFFYIKGANTNRVHVILWQFYQTLNIKYECNSDLVTQHNYSSPARLTSRNYPGKSVALWASNNVYNV